MGKITQENRRALESAPRYEDAVLNGMDEQEFTTVLGQLIEQKGVSVLSIVEQTGISKSYINRLRSPSVKNARPGRHIILNIALAIDAGLDETNRLLKLAKYQELYARDSAESLILWGMLKKLPGQDIRRMLQEKGFDYIFKETQERRPCSP